MPMPKFSMASLTYACKTRSTAKPDKEKMCCFEKGILSWINEYIIL